MDALPLDGLFDDSLPTHSNDDSVLATSRSIIRLKDALFLHPMRDGITSCKNHVRRP